MLSDTGSYHRCKKGRFRKCPDRLERCWHPESQLLLSAHSNVSYISLMFPGSIESPVSAVEDSSISGTNVDPVIAQSDALVAIDDVQKSLNRSRASVYRYTNTDPSNLNPPFNPKKLNPEYRSDQKDPLLFHPNEVARFAKDVLRIKEVTVEVLNSPSTATQQVLSAILEELRQIRTHLEDLPAAPSDLAARRERQERPAA